MKKSCWKCWIRKRYTKCWIFVSCSLPWINTFQSRRDVWHPWEVSYTKMVPWAEWRLFNGFSPFCRYFWVVFSLGDAGPTPGWRGKFHWGWWIIASKENLWFCFPVGLCWLVCVWWSTWDIQGRFGRFSTLFGKCLWTSLHIYKFLGLGDWPDCCGQLM